MSRQRLLILDADIPKRLAAALEHRSRRAVTASRLHLAKGVKDGDLLGGLAAQFASEDWVLVTGDDRMPLEHGSVIKETEATVAIIHPDRPDGITQHAWRIDVVQRFAHTMQSQAPQTVRRYTVQGSNVWTPRRHHLLEIARKGWVPWTPAADPDTPERPPPKPSAPPPPTLWEQ